MIAFAPITRLTDWLTSDKGWRAMAPRIPSAAGLAALEIAKRELGNGETTGNNSGPAIDRYRGPLKGRGAWCAALMYYCVLVGSRSMLKRQTSIKRTHGARKLFRRIVRAGHLVKHRDICPGDFVLWARGRQGGWQGHIGIVSSVERATGRWWYIAGNEGSFPAKVREYEGTHKKRRIGFGRLY